jgi:hypothetical protein
VQGSEDPEARGSTVWDANLGSDGSPRRGRRGYPPVPDMPGVQKSRLTQFPFSLLYINRADYLCGGGCPRKPQAGLLEEESRLRMPRAGELGPSRDLHPSALPDRGMPPTCRTDRVGRRYPCTQHQFQPLADPCYGTEETLARPEGCLPRCPKGRIQKEAIGLNRSRLRSTRPV